MRLAPPPDTDDVTIESEDNRDLLLIQTADHLKSECCG